MTLLQPLSQGKIRSVSGILVVNNASEKQNLTWMLLLLAKYETLSVYLFDLELWWMKYL